MLLENMSGASIGHIEKQEERGVRNNGEMSGAAARTGDLIRKREGNYIKIKQVGLKKKGQQNRRGNENAGINGKYVYRGGKQEEPV